MKKTWYGVYAENGLGIYTNYDRLMRNSMYTQGEHIKKFGTQEEAEDYAISGFTILNGTGALLATIPDSYELSVNYFYMKKSIIEPQYPEITESKIRIKKQNRNMREMEAVEEQGEKITTNYTGKKEDIMRKKTNDTTITQGVILVTIEEAARLMSLGKSTIRRLAQESNSARKIGRSYRIDIAKLTEYINTFEM